MDPLLMHFASGSPGTGFLAKIGHMDLPRGHSDVYGGAEGLRHHLCFSHGEHRDEGTPQTDLEELHHDEHDAIGGRHLGEYNCPEYEHDAENEPGEFDDIHDQIGDIHRGIGVHLPDRLHRLVHDESRPVHERAQALLDHVSEHEGHWGMHWTTEPHVAEDFAEHAARHYAREDQRGREALGDFSWGHEQAYKDTPLGKPGTAVVFHAHPPDLENIETDGHRLSNGGGYGYSEHGEREVPIRDTQSLDLKGISWAPMHSDEDTPGHGEYTRHDLDEPGHHTAAMDSLDDVRKAGYCTDEWGRWQQGQCGTYAYALTRLKPGLRFGTAGTEDTPDSHFFAHDDHHAYDSAGRHPLPYRGVHGNLTQSDLDQDPADWGVPGDESGPEGPEPNVAAAQEHARRNRILEGGHQRTAAAEPEWFYGEQPAHTAELPEEMHRGFPFRLPPELHALVHDESRPADERARALMAHLDQHSADQARYGDGGTGVHWSTKPSVARGFATRYDTWNHPIQSFVHDPESTQVVLHARTAEPGQMIRGKRTMRERDIFGINHGEGEIPLRKGSRVQLTGISWARNGKDTPLTRHDFPAPIQRRAGRHAEPEPSEILAHFEAAARPDEETLYHSGGKDFPGEEEWVHLGTREAALNRAKDWNKERQRRGEAAMPAYLHHVQLSGRQPVGGPETDAVVNQPDIGSHYLKRGHTIVPYVNEFEDPGTISYLAHRSAVRLVKTEPLTAKEASRPGRDQEQCSCCHGKGEHGDGSRCERCDGTGAAPRDTRDPNCPGQPAPRRKHWRERQAASEGVPEGIREMPLAEHRRLSSEDYPGRPPSYVRKRLQVERPVYYARLRDHISQHGAQVPVLLSRNKYGTEHIMNGTHRWAIANELKIPIQIGDWDNPEHRAYAENHPATSEWEPQRRNAYGRTEGLLKHFGAFEDASPEARERRRDRASRWLDSSEYAGGTTTGIPAKWGPQARNYEIHHILDSHGWPRDEAEREDHWSHLEDEWVDLRQPIHTHQGHVYPGEVRRKMDHALHEEETGRPWDEEPAKFVRHEGRTYLLDGHHRFAEHRLLGRQYMQGRVFDTSRPETYPANCPECREMHGEGLEKEGAVDTSYRGRHQGPDEEHGAPLHEIERVMPDFYDHPEYYGANPHHDRESVRQIRRARGNPDAPVTIYRALPHGHREINKGDWVTTSGNYAEDHAYQSGEEGADWPVIKATVPARHLRSQGDEPNEFSYHGPGIESAELHHPGSKPPVVAHFEAEASQPEEYGISHRPMEDTDQFHNLGETTIGQDAYDHPEYYGDRGQYGQEGIRQLRAARGKPDHPVKIYRAMHQDAPREINHGDWVTANRRYAEFHAETQGYPSDDWHVISATVPAHHLRTGAGDLHEWGYWGPKVSGERPDPKPGRRQAAADPGPAGGVTVEHSERPSGGATYPHMHVLTAAHPDGTQAELRYMLSKRNGKGIVDHAFVPGGYARSLGVPLVREARRLHPGTFVKGLPGLDEDWGKHLPSVSSLHRHLTMRLEPADRDFVHDESVPRAQRARRLMDLMERGGPSMHWASQRGRAAAEKFGDHDFRSPEDTHIALSAEPPAREHVETDPERISRNGGYAYQAPDWEVPLKEGVPVTVSSVRWRTGSGGWTRHQFRGGHQFTAGRKAEAAGQPEDAPPEELAARTAAMRCEGAWRILDQQAQGHGDCNARMVWLTEHSEPRCTGCGHRSIDPETGHRPVQTREMGPRAWAAELPAREIAKRYGALSETEAAFSPLKAWAESKPHQAAVRLAQDETREAHPELIEYAGDQDPEGFSEQAGATLRRMLEAGGYPPGKAERSFVMRHPEPDRNSSSVVMMGTRTGVALHPLRWDHGTLAHEAAHIIANHHAGIDSRGIQGDEIRHGPHFARAYAGTLNTLSPGAGDDFARHHQDALRLVSNYRSRVHNLPRIDGRDQAPAPVIAHFEAEGARWMSLEQILALSPGDYPEHETVRDALGDIREKMADEPGRARHIRKRMSQGMQPGDLVVNDGQLDDGHRRAAVAHELGWDSMAVRSGKWKPFRGDDDEGHEAALDPKDQPWMQRGVDLATEHWDGETGNKDHMTHRETGWLPTEAIEHMHGLRGERPGEHRNRQGQDWDDWSGEVGRNGIRSPLHITVDHGEPPRISEGNHRRDAAVRHGHARVPVEITYFGNAQDEGTVWDRHLNQQHEWNSHHLAAAGGEGYLRNPYHGTEEFGGRDEWSHTWFHGTRGEPSFGERKGHGDVAERMKTPPEERKMSSGWPQPNQMLGVHFSPLHEVAHKFVGSVSSQPGSLVHARLKFSNPAHYPNERGVDLAVARWADKHYPHWHDEKLNANQAWNYSDQEGTHRDWNATGDEDRLGRKAQDILQWHPHLPEILKGFTGHLRDQGHGGITYGNDVEGPYETDATRGGHAGVKYIEKYRNWPHKDRTRSISAIALPEDIETTHVEHVSPWQAKPEPHQRTWEDISDGDEPDEMRDKILAYHRQNGGKLPFRLASVTAARDPYNEETGETNPWHQRWPEETGEEMAARREDYIGRVMQGHGVDRENAVSALRQVSRDAGSDHAFADGRDYGFINDPGHHGDRFFTEKMIGHLNKPETWAGVPVTQVPTAEIHASQNWLRPRTLAHNLFHPGKREPSEEESGHPDIDPGDDDPSWEQDQDLNMGKVSRFVRRADGRMQVADGHHRVATDMILGKAATPGKVIEEHELRRQMASGPSETPADAPGMRRHLLEDHDKTSSELPGADAPHHELADEHDHSHEFEQEYLDHRHGALEVTASVPEYQHRPEFRMAPEDWPKDRQMEYHERQFDAERDWKASIRRGLSLGHLDIGRAKELGYHPGGHEHQDTYHPDTTGWHPMPEHLYHVTTNLPGVRERGLRSQRELGVTTGHGLGSSEPDSISLTDSPRIAHGILHGLHEYHHFLNHGKPEDLIERARRGDGGSKPFHHDLIRHDGGGDWEEGKPLPRSLDAMIRGKTVSHSFGTQADIDKEKGPGWVPHPESEPYMGRTDGEPMHSHWERDATPEEQLHRKSSFYKAFALFRQAAGGSYNPGFMSNDVKRFASMDPSHFALLHVRPKPGAQGYRLPGEEEWRTTTGDALEVHKAEQLHQGHLREASLQKEAAMEARGARYEPGIRNPHTGGDQWFHGTRAYPEELSQQHFADPADMDPGAYEQEQEEPHGHWNALLGTHFTSDHEVAREFARGEHNSSANDRADDPGRPVHEGVVHARLHLRNPKVFESEHDMDHAAYEEEFRRGNHPSNHWEGDLDEDDDYTSEMWPNAHRIREQYGNGKIPRGDHEPYNGPNGGHPVRGTWLSTHPDRNEIARRFRERLEAQGHDGIIYGNEYEKSQHGRKAVSAIAFRPHQIEIDQHHHADHECLSPQEAELHRARLPQPGQEEIPGVDKHTERMPARSALLEHFAAAEPAGWTYDSNIVGQTTAHGPEGQEHTVYTSGMGLKNLRHPEDVPVPLYHGSNHEFGDGDEIEAGHPGNFVSRMKHVYLTEQAEGDDRHKGARGYGRHVYEVAPTTWYGHRRDARGIDWATDGPVRVIRRVPDPRQATAAVVQHFAAGPHPYIAPPQAGEETWRHLQEAHGVRPSGGGRTPGESFMIGLHDKFHGGQTADQRRIPHQHEIPGAAGEPRPDISSFFTPVPAEELEAQRKAREPKPERLDDREYSIRDVSRHYDWEGFDPHEIGHLVRHPEHAVFTREDVPVHTLRHVDSGGGLVHPPSYSDIASQDEDEQERLHGLEQGYEQGASIPPIVVVRDGEHHIIADGSHRAAIHALRGSTHIPAFVTQRTIHPEQHTAALEPEPDRGDRWHEFRNRYSEDLHRGVHVALPEDLDRHVHDESVPREDRARALQEHFSRDGLGMHWTPHIDIAHRSIGNAADAGHGLSGGRLYHPGGPDRTTDVMFHIRQPGERNRLRNHQQIDEHEIGWQYSRDEDEFPLKPGSPLRLSGISWKRHDPQHPMEAYEHADFTKPMRHVSSAVQGKAVRTPDDGLPEPAVTPRVPFRKLIERLPAAVASCEPQSAAEAGAMLGEVPVLLRTAAAALGSLAARLDGLPVEQGTADATRSLAVMLGARAEEAAHILRGTEGAWSKSPSQPAALPAGPKA